MTHRRGAIAAVLAAGLLTLTACGGDGLTRAQRHRRDCIAIQISQHVPQAALQDAADNPDTAPTVAALMDAYPDLKSAISRQC